MSNEINHERRRFFGAAAMTLAAAQFGLVRSASAQSKTAGPPAVNTGEFFPGFSTELVETSGTTIHVLRKGAGRPLLLLHGYPETHLTWHKVAPQLAEQFSVVVPDLRGYGDSGVITVTSASWSRLMIAGRAWRTGSVSITPRALRKPALWTSRPRSQCIRERTRNLLPNICGGSF